MYIIFCIVYVWGWCYFKMLYVIDFWCCIKIWYSLFEGFKNWMLLVEGFVVGFIWMVFFLSWVFSGRCVWLWLWLLCEWLCEWLCGWLCGWLWIIFLCICMWLCVICVGGGLMLFLIDMCCLIFWIMKKESINVGMLVIKVL